MYRTLFGKGKPGLALPANSHCNTLQQHTATATKKHALFGKGETGLALPARSH